MRTAAFLLGAAAVAGAALWLHPMPATHVGLGPAVGGSREVSRSGEILIPNNGWRPATLSFRAKAPVQSGFTCAEIEAAQTASSSRRAGAIPKAFIFR